MAGGGEKGGVIIYLLLPSAPAPPAWLQQPGPSAAFPCRVLAAGHRPWVSKALGGAPRPLPSRGFCPREGKKGNSAGETQGAIRVTSAWRSWGGPGAPHNQPGGSLCLFGGGSCCCLCLLVQPPHPGAQLTRASPFSPAAATRLSSLGSFWKSLRNEQLPTPEEGAARGRHCWGVTEGRWGGGGHRTPAAPLRDAAGREAKGPAPPPNVA